MVYFFFWKHKVGFVMGFFFYFIFIIGT